MDINVHITLEPQTKELRNMYEAKLKKSSGNSVVGTTGEDAGFDIFCPEHRLIEWGSKSNIVDLGVKVVMTVNNKPVAFEMWPRSSLGSKTPLRVANSIGLIDAGYRDTLKVILDHNPPTNGHSFPHGIWPGERLVQICHPSKTSMTWSILDEGLSLEEIYPSARGTGGLGSTGK